MIHIGTDHAGFELKKSILDLLINEKIEFKDHGTYSTERVDYPDYAHSVAISVEGDKESMGILICGSANGVCITANKHQGIRAALCWNEEVAKLAKQHNNANIIGIPARFIDTELAKKMVLLFLNTPFEGGRHLTRVNKISCN